MKIEAEAQAEATRLAAEADAEAIRVKAEADAQVLDQFAREMELRRMEVQKVRAYGARTVFVPESQAAAVSSAMAVGLAAGVGADARK
jgi:regulator of protease activity HflC (stomatin/prohibitin superfamily)